MRVTASLRVTQCGLAVALGGAQIRAEYEAKNPGKPWPAYDVGGMFANLFTKPPGWRAAEGHSQAALGYPE